MGDVVNLADYRKRQQTEGEQRPSQELACGIDTLMSNFRSRRLPERTARMLAGAFQMCQSEGSLAAFGVQDRNPEYPWTRWDLTILGYIPFATLSIAGNSFFGPFPAQVDLELPQTANFDQEGVSAFIRTYLSEWLVGHYPNQPDDHSNTKLFNTASVTLSYVLGYLHSNSSRVCVGNDRGNPMFLFYLRGWEDGTAMMIETRPLRF